MGETQDKRNILLIAAKGLHEQLRVLNEAVRGIINTLISDSDQLLTEAADEKEAERGMTVHKVKYTKPSEIVQDAPGVLPRSAPPPSGRKCGKCGQRGHNARTCKR